VIVLEQSQGVHGVAHRGVAGDPEYGRQTKRIPAAGECFFELPVDAQPFQGCAQAAEVEDPGGADRAVVQGGFLADQQVRAGAVRRAAASLIELVVLDAMGHLVEREGCSGDGESPVAESDVVELQRADLVERCGVVDRVGSPD